MPLRPLRRGRGVIDAAIDPAVRLARFAVEVKTRREVLGLTLRQCASSAGVCEDTVSRVERGFGMSVETYLRLAAWLEGGSDA